MTNPIICTWEARLPKGSEIVWPDGCRDVIAIIPRGQPPRIVCTGLDGCARRIDCADETRFLGLRLAPGVTFPWEKKDAGKMRTDVDLSHYVPSLHQGVIFQADHETALADLVRQVDSLASPPLDWVVDYFGNLRIGKAASVTSLSERSVRRRLVQATGAPPIFWQGLVRARKAALDLSRWDAPLASIAADHGFADQAHMSREIRRWFGCTPMTLRANREQAVARLAAPDMLDGS